MSAKFDLYAKRYVSISLSEAYLFEVCTASVHLGFKYKDFM